MADADGDYDDLVKSPPIVAELNVAGYVWKVIYGPKKPQSYYAAEPDTLSYHFPLVEEAGTKTEVVMSSNCGTVIVAVKQGLM